MEFYSYQKLMQWICQEENYRDWSQVIGMYEYNLSAKVDARGESNFRCRLFLQDVKSWGQQVVNLPPEFAAAYLTSFPPRIVLGPINIAKK
jgi:hypothetical protein